MTMATVKFNASADHTELQIECDQRLMTVHQVFSSFSFYFFFVFRLFKIYKLNDDGHHPPRPYKIPVSQQQTQWTTTNGQNKLEREQQHAWPP